MNDDDAEVGNLRSENVRLKAAIAAVNGVLWTNDGSGRMAGEQPGWQALTGQSAGQYVGYGWTDAIHPHDVEETVAAWKDAVTSRTPYVVEHRVRRADGEWRLFSVKAVPITGEDGSVIEWVGVHTDVTDQRDVAKALAESEDNYRNAVELNPQTTWTARPDGQLDRVAERWREWTGGSGLGSSWGEAMHPDDLERSVDVWTRSVTTGEPYDIEHRARMVCGEYHWMHSRAYPRRDEKGRIVKWYGSTEDIEERKRAEEKLRSSEEQFRGFAQAVPNQIWTAKPDGYLDWFNDRVYDYIGVQPGSLDGKGAWAANVHPDDMTTAADVWLRSLQTGEVYETEFRIRSAAGEYRWFLVRAVAVKSDDGRIARWIGTNTDIEDSKRQTEELARFAATLEEQVLMRTGELMAAEEALRQSQKMEAVGQLTGGLAHDFNNLLAGISGSLELIQRRTAKGQFDGLERYVVAGQEAAKRAAALTHRLLAFSRRQTLDPRPTDIDRLVEGMAEIVKNTIGPSIALKIDAVENPWPVLVDPNQLENALLNLCINARDALPDGGSIIVRSRNLDLSRRDVSGLDTLPGDYLAVSIEDDGVGMPAETVARAFEPFFTTKPTGLGTGLGLSMIYGFARQSGGAVKISSRDGEGTNVTLYLPRHEVAQAPDALEEHALESVVSASGQTILVIDDEALIRMLVVDTLQELGYQTLEAGDGPQGMRLLRSDARIDLLVTDVGLPNGMNGRQVADAARELRPGLKVLFMTGYAENSVLDRGHLDPDMQIMTKPFQMDDFSQRIREMAGQGNDITPRA
ncbi:PAS domain-containing protein [Pararhizobium sp. PWRC1-1]|uniref:PAS domain-containing protein n=1 Tax=Pararhizobium sp. PWRC1-1 TaxID=2804566 RepID=UPI003CF84663